MEFKNYKLLTSTTKMHTDIENKPVVTSRKGKKGGQDSSRGLRGTNYYVQINKLQEYIV